MSIPLPFALRHESDSDHIQIGELLVLSFVEMYARKMPEVVVSEERKNELRDIAGKRAFGETWVLVREREIAGTFFLVKPTAAYPEKWLPRSALLKHLAVEERFRGQGLTQIMLQQCVTLAKSWNAESITLTVRKGAHGVAGTYARYGFVRDPRGDAKLPTVELEGYILDLKA